MKNKGISIREILIITFGMFLVAAGVYFFMIPGNIVAGSVSGLALVLSKLLGIQVSVLTFISKYIPSYYRVYLHRKRIWSKDSVHIYASPCISLDFRAFHTT